MAELDQKPDPFPSLSVSNDKRLLGSRKEFVLLEDLLHACFRVKVLPYLFFITVLHFVPIRERR